MLIVEVYTPMNVKFRKQWGEQVFESQKVPPLGRYIEAKLGDQKAVRDFCQKAV